MKKFSLILIVLSLVGIVFGYMVDVYAQRVLFEQIRMVSIVGLGVGAVLLIANLLWKRKH